MKIFSIFVLIIFISGCASKFSEWDQAKEGMKAATPLIEYIESYESITGKYPESLSKLKVPTNILEEAKRHGISYLTWNNQKEYGVNFKMRGFILNPHCGYGSHLEKWQCLGK